MKIVVFVVFLGVGFHETQIKAESHKYTEREQSGITQNLGESEKGLMGSAVNGFHTKFNI